MTSNSSLLADLVGAKTRLVELDAARAASRHFLFKIMDEMGRGVFGEILFYMVPDRPNNVRE
jgi:hypothetical protein